MNATSLLLSQQDRSWSPVRTSDYEASGSSVFLEINALEKAMVSA